MALDLSQAMPYDETRHREKGRQMGKDKGRLTAERHAALMAVAHSLPGLDQELVRRRAARQWPRLDGADVADVLDVTVDHDMFLDQTEPFFERFADQIPSFEGNYASIYAMHAVILLGLELAPARVACFMQRAGVTEAPRYPDVEVGLRLEGSYRDGASCANHLLLMGRAAQGLRAHRVTEHEITQFRDSVRETGLPGHSRNVADIAAWVTLADRYAPLPCKAYDPVDDIAVVLAHLRETGITGAGYGQAGLSLDNLRSHLDLSTPEAARASLAAFLGREG